MAISTTNKVVLELRDQVAAAREATRRAQELQIAYSDPRAIAMLKKQAQAVKDLAREEEASARARRKADVGGLAEGLENASKKLGEFQGKLNTLAYQSGSVFAQLSGSIMGFAAVADTGTGVATLTTSFKLLGQAIGEAALPYLQDMSRWIQRAANWIRGLDESTKGSIAKILVWTAAIAGTVMVGTKLAAMVVGAGKAIAAFGAYLSSSAMAINPWLAGLAALAAVLVTVTGSMGKLKNAAGETLSRVGAGVGFLGANLESLLSGNGFTGMKEWADKQNGADRVKKSGEYTDSRLGVDLLQGRAGRGEFGGEAKKWFEQNKAIDQGDLKKLEKALPDDQKGIIDQLKRFQDLHKQMFPGAANDDLLLSQRGMPQPGFHTGAGYGESLQLASLQGEAGGSAEAVLLQRQLEATERHNGELLKRLEDQTEAIKRITPPWRT